MFPLQLDGKSVSRSSNRIEKSGKGAERFEVANNNTPSSGNVTEEKKAELDEFIEYTKIAVISLGYKVFQPIDEKAIAAVTSESSPSVPEQKFIAPDLFLQGVDIQGYGRQTSDGFVVLRGTRIRNGKSASCLPSRESYLEKHKDAIQDFVLEKDILFNSPSTAGVFVTGRSINGLVAWKTTDGRTLKSLEDES